MSTADPQATLAPEPRLLLAAVRLPYDDDARQVVSELAGQADWPALLELGRRHAVLPLCSYNLRQAGLMDSIPADAQAVLTDAYDASLARTTNISALLGRLLTRAQETGLPLLCLKGPLLAEQCYPHPATRPMTDVDLLVQPHDLARAQALLAEAGYRLPPSTANPIYVHGAASGDGLWDLQVELHTELLTGALGNRKVARLETRYVWERAAQVTLGGCPCWALSPADNLIFLAAHMTVHHGKLQLIWLADLAYFLRAHHEQVNWAELVQAARRYGVRQAVGWPLWLARDLLAAPVPEGALAALQIGTGAGVLAQFVDPQAIFGETAQPVGDVAILARAMFLEHFSDRLRYFAEMARAAGPAAWPSLAWRFLRAAWRLLV